MAQKKHETGELRPLDYRALVYHSQNYHDAGGETHTLVQSGHLQIKYVLTEKGLAELEYWKKGKQDA